MELAPWLALQLDDTRSWTLKLLDDMRGDEWAFQPAPGLAHATWLCGHLAVSQHTLVHVRCLGESCLPESFIRHFPIGAPVVSTGKYDYPPIKQILQEMEHVNEVTVNKIRTIPEALLSEPAYAADGRSPHPHYRDKGGAILHCIRHEAFHAGQIAMIRRLLGKPFLR